MKKETKQLPPITPIHNKDFGVCMKCEEDIVPIEDGRFKMPKSCTHCDRDICRKCWDEEDGGDNWKNCPQCPGSIYL